MEKILHRTLSAEMLQKGDDIIRKYKDANNIISNLIQNLGNSLMNIVSSRKTYITMQITLSDKSLSIMTDGSSTMNCSSW